MEFTSVEQIKQEFGLQQIDDLTELRRKLRKMQALIHPDRSGGDFASAEDKESFFSLDAAIQFLDENLGAQTALVPITTVTDLVRVVKDLVPASRESSFEARLSEQIEVRIREIRSQHLFPKISTSVLAGAITTAWLFPSLLAKHPIMSLLVDITSPVFTLIWVFSVFLTSSTWVFCKINESRQEQFKSRLKLESFQNGLFDNFVRTLPYSVEYRFTKDDFISFLIESVPHVGRSRRVWDFFVRPRQIDLELAQSLADVVFSRAESNGILRRDKRPSMSEFYLLEPSYIERADHL